MREGIYPSTTIVDMYAAVSVILAIVVLGERLLLFTITGAILCIRGPLIMPLKEGKESRSAEAKINPNVSSLDKKTLYLGVFHGLVAAILWRSSPLFIKLAMNNGGTAMSGILYLIAPHLLLCAPGCLIRKIDRKYSGKTGLH